MPAPTAPLLRQCLEGWRRVGLPARWESACFCIGVLLGSRLAMPTSAPVWHTDPKADLRLSTLVPCRRSHRRRAPPRDGGHCPWPAVTSSQLTARLRRGQAQQVLPADSLCTLRSTRSRLWWQLGSLAPRTGAVQCGSGTAQLSPHPACCCIPRHPSKHLMPSLVCHAEPRKQAASHPLSIRCLPRVIM